MPKVNSDPEKLRPYLALGVDLSWTEGDKDASGRCLFCNREGKFNVVIETGQYRCVACGQAGNTYVFIRELLRLSEEDTTDYDEIQHNRGLLVPDGLIEWGVAKSIISGEWIIPGYGADGKVMTLYRWHSIKGKFRALAIPTMGVHLFGMSTWDPNKGIVELLEGPWDGLTMFETLASIKYEEEQFLETASYANSLLADRNVLAYPGATSFFEHWVPLFADKVVNIWSQNDHESIDDKGRVTPAASYEGTKRIAAMLLSAEKPPLQVNYLTYGEKGWNPDLPHGYDIRDALNTPPNTLGSRLKAFSGLVGRLCQVPAEWAKNVKNGRLAKSKPEELKLKPCKEWKTLVNSWKKALRWIEGLDTTLSVMLASITSTMAVGDQLWIMVVSPASTGKSVLCEALSSNKKYVFAKSTIRGFHSGFGPEGEDNSLLTLAAGKTLVTKDGDTLLQAPNLGQILSEARDVYDTVSRTHYRNKQSKNYEGVRMTWILCGTASLLALDTSELGERFLKCIIMDGIDDELEDEILLRSAYSENAKMSMASGIEAATKDSEDMLDAKALTGGYITYLRENASDLLSMVTVDNDIMEKMTRFGKFIAFMRARPSTRQDEHNEREFAARLVKQIVRLAKCLAVVLNRTDVDEEVMKRVKKVTLDTSRGIVLTITVHLWYAEEDESGGSNVAAIATVTHKTNDEIKKLIRFMRHIGMIESFRPEHAAVKSQPVIRLTSTLRKLYQEVMK